MPKNLRVGNLGEAIDLAKLSEIFSTHGSVKRARIVEDQYSGKSRGFGFVEMSNEDEAATCISRVDGTEHFGRTLNVTQAPDEKTKRGARKKST